MSSPWDLLWLFFISSSLQPVIQRALMTMSRRRLLALIAARRDATVITLIHRQETISLLGIPLARYIDIDEAESVLRAIRETPLGKAIEIILHTPGGLVLATRSSSTAMPLSDPSIRSSGSTRRLARRGGFNARAPRRPHPAPRRCGS